MRMAATTAERETAARAGAGWVCHGRNSKDEISGESCATVHVASVSVAPFPSTNVKVVRAGEGGVVAGTGGAVGGMRSRRGLEEEAEEQ